MLLHKDILDNMTAGQKISLICDGVMQSLSDEKADEFPSVRISPLRTNAKDGYVYPSDFALANSFDPELVARVNAELASRAKQRGANVVRIDTTKPKTCAYSEGECEDDHLETAYLCSKIKGVRRAGVSALLGGYAVDTVDADFCDVEPDLKTLREFYFRPLSAAMNEDGCEIVETTRFKRLFGEYEDVNRTVVSRFLKNDIGRAIPKVVGLDLDRTRECYEEGALFGGDGARNYLESAYSRYQQLKKEAKEGVGSYDDVDIAVKKGVAVSDELLDKWADKALDLAIRSNLLPVDQGYIGDAEELCRQATLQSFVLLKNTETLPLKSSDKVAVIGALSKSKRFGNFFEYAMQVKDGGYGFTPTGYSDGYDLVDQRTPALIQEAVDAVGGANKVIVFLGLNDERETDMRNKRVTTLPAAQLALLDALSAQKKKIIAVVSGNYPIDMSFDSCCSAVVVAPKGCTMRNASLYALLSGAENFSGRLANTYYDNTDEYFSDLRNDKELGRNLVGPFLNYKYYTSAKIKVRYPFGYGLSYTEFNYSGLKIVDGTVHFTVKNVGKTSGYAVCQIYASLPDSVIVRADRELKGLGKVFLNAGESKKMSVKLNERSLAVYEPKSDTWLVESGNYKISVGNSSEDIKATANFVVAGEKPSGSPIKREDYLQTVSNIVSGGYKLKPRENFVNKKAKTTFTILTSVFFVLFVALSLSWYAGLPLLPFALISGVAAAATAIALASTNNSSKNKLKQEKEKMGKIINKMPPEETLKGKPLAELFIREFTEPEADKKEEVAYVAVKKTAEDLNGYFIKGLTLKTVEESFVKFCEERGYVVDGVMVRTVFASMLSSRLLVIANDDKRLSVDFAQLLAEYFGTNAISDEVEGKTSAADLLLDENGEERPIGLALEAAANQKHNLNFAVLKNVDFSNVEDVFSRFMRYVVNPAAESTLSVRTSRGIEKEYTLCDNLWFIMTCSSTAVFKAPKFILEAASVINLKLAANYGDRERKEYAIVSVHQFRSFVDSAVDKVEVNEGLWKRIDKLEEFVKSKTGYSIGNKLWQRIERFMAAYVLSGGESEEAEDSLVAVKLLVSVIKELDGVPDAFENGEDVMHLIESIFGEDNVSVCQNVVKCSKYAKLENRDQGEGR